VTPDGCSKAKALLKIYTDALALFHKSQERMLIGITADHPKYPEIHELREQAYYAMIQSQRLYREHVREHGCRAPGPKEAIWEWVN